MRRIMFLALLLASTAQAEIYRWKDGRGTVHYTNSEYEIPARYRNRVVIVNLGLPAVASSTQQPSVSYPQSPASITSAMPAQSERAVTQPAQIVTPSGTPKTQNTSKRQRLHRERSSHSDE